MSNGLASPHSIKENKTQMMVKFHPTLSFTPNPKGRTIPPMMMMMMRGMDDFSKWDFTPIPKKKNHIDDDEDDDDDRNG